MQEWLQQLQLFCEENLLSSVQTITPRISEAIFLIKCALSLEKYPHDLHPAIAQYVPTLWLLMCLLSFVGTNSLGTSLYSSL